MNDKSIELALRTWYPKDHLLHFDLHHPLGKLVGEWGELLDDYMKHLYKPGYEWEPTGELVDIWYYIRILAYQTKAILTFISVLDTEYYEGKIECLIAYGIQSTNNHFIKLLHKKSEDKTYRPEYNNFSDTLNYNYSILLHLCTHFDITIDQLTEASWEKLKPGSKRGGEWMKTKEATTNIF